MTKSVCHTLTSWVSRVMKLVMGYKNKNKNKELKQNLFGIEAKKKEGLRGDDVKEKTNGM